MTEIINIPTPKVTFEIIKAKFSTELTKLKYQDALQKLESYTVTEDNISEAQEKIKKARKFITDIKAIHKEGKAAAWEECGFWDAALKDFTTPLETALNKKSADAQKIGDELTKRKAKEDAENQRKDGIKTAINIFILDQSRAIAESETDTQLIAIEKLIGSHKANSSRYQKFLPDLIERCNELTPILKKQKENIREMRELSKKEEEALASGNDEKVIEIMEQGEALSNKIDEAKVIVQEKAIDGATRIALKDTGATQIFSAPKPRRTTISYEIVDEKKAFAAGMLVCEINKEKANAQAKVVKQSLPEGQEEMTINGVRYFIQKTF